MAKWLYMLSGFALGGAVKVHHDGDPARTAFLVAATILLFWLGDLFARAPDQ